MKVRFMKEWISGEGTKCEPGETVEVDDTRGAELVEAETAVVWSDAYEKLLGDSQKLNADTLDAAIDKGLEKLAADFGGMRSDHSIEVGPDRKTLDKTDGFKAVAEWAYHMQLAGLPGATPDPRLKQHEKAVGSDEMSTVEAPYGGYWLMPSEFSSTMLQVTVDSSVLLSRATKVPVDQKAGSIEFPAIDQTSLADGQLYGGIQALYRDEFEQMAGKRPKGARVKLELHECYIFMYVTDKMLRRSPITMSAMFNEMATTVMRDKYEQVVIRGTGAGQPKGVLNAACKIEVAKEDGQDAATVMTENVVNMYSRCYGDIRPKACWIYNQDIEPQLLTMVMTIGTGGVPMFLPAGGLSAKPYNTLLNLPAFPVKHCSTLGTAGDIILGVWDQYLFAQPAGEEFEIASSIHVRFDYAESCFRILSEHDGQCWWKSALTPAQGSNTLSPFITLAARA